MQIFENEFGKWKNMGKSSIAYLMEQFPEMFNRQNIYFDERLNSFKLVADEAIVYPAFIETQDSYIIRFLPGKSYCPIGVVCGVPYVTGTKKKYKPFNVMSLFETVED